jgi:hypothetical protein
MKSGVISWKTVLYTVILLSFFSALSFSQTATQLTKFKGDEYDQQNYPEIFEFDDQYGQPGKELKRWYWVQVLDENGAGVDDVPVTFTVTKGGGSIRPNRQHESHFIEQDISVVVNTKFGGIARAKLTLGSEYLAENIVTAAAEENGELMSGAPLTFRAFAIDKPDAFEKSLKLNGERQYLVIPDAAFLDVYAQKELTIELWFKPQKMHYFNLMNKIGRCGPDHTGITRYNGWALDFNRPFNKVYDDGGDVLPNHFGIFAGQYEENSFGYMTAGSGTENDSTAGEWLHLAIVQKWGPAYWNTEFTELSLKFYLNGNLYLHTGHPHEINMQGDPLVIGGLLPAIEDAVQLPEELYLDGMVDEVRIWNYAKDRQHLISTLVDTLGPEYYATPDSGLVGYYRFEELEHLGIGGDGLANDIRDLSTSRNHANAVGGADVILTKGATLVNNSGLHQPDNFSLKNYPNPFNPSTTLNYEIAQSSLVSLKIFDVLGRQVDVLVNEIQGAGAYEVKWNAKYMSSGIYFGRLNVNGKINTIKMLLEK